MTSYGREIKDDHLAVKWESEENIENIESHVKYYLKGLWVQKITVVPSGVGIKTRTHLTDVVQDAHAHLSFAETREHHMRRVNHQQFQML